MNRPAQDPDDVVRSALAEVEHELAREQPAVADWVPRVRRRLAVRRAQRRGGAALGVLVLAGVALYAVPGLAGRDEESLVASPVTAVTPSSSAGPTAAAAPTPEAPSAAASAAAPSPAGPSPTVEPAPLPPPGPAASPQPRTYEGRVVDAAGQPLAGIHVWALATNAISGRPADVMTGPDGRFQLPCDSGRKVLLASWQLGTRQKAATRNLAPVFAGGAEGWTTAQQLGCRRETTTMRAGAVLTGKISQATEEGTEPVPDHQQIDDGVGAPDAMDLQGSILARWDPVDDAYRFVGLPTGNVPLSDGPNGAMNGRYAVTAGEVRTLNWVLTCRSCQRPRPEPTPV